MTNIPEKIYLQIDADGETPEDFNELVGVTWCADKINDNDLVYVLEQKKKNVVQAKDKSGGWLSTPDIV